MPIIKAELRNPLTVPKPELYSTQFRADQFSKISVLEPGKYAVVQHNLLGSGIEPTPLKAEVQVFENGEGFFRRREHEDEDWGYFYFDEGNQFQRILSFEMYTQELVSIHAFYSYWNQIFLNNFVAQLEQEKHQLSQ